MSEKKKSKFDPGTIIGVTLAILLFFGLQYYMTSQQAEKQKAYQIAYDKWKKDQDALAAANAANAALTNPNPTGVTPSISAGTPAENPNAAQLPAAAEPARTPDIKVTSDLYDITFTADGGALRSATFNQEWINPLKKDAKGLEFLAEIESGKLTYGITRFEVGTGGERTVFEGLAGPQRALSRRIWKLDSDSGSFNDKGVRTVVYSVALTGGHTLKRTYTVHKSLEHVDTELTLTNGSDKPVTFSYVMYGPTGVLLDGPKDNPKTGAAVFIRTEIAGRAALPAGGEPEVKMLYSDQTSVPEPERTVSKDENLWACVKNRFFSAILISRDASQVIRFTAEPLQVDAKNADKRYAEPNIAIVLQRRMSAEIAPNATAKPDTYTLYMGSNMSKPLQRIEEELGLQQWYLNASVQYVELFYKRWPLLDKFAQILLKLFDGLHAVFNNYGIAVILLTLVIKLCLHPLQRKMMISMNKLQKLQPELKKIQEKYKGQEGMAARQKMALEQQDLMKRAGASPASGCLPMFVQIPVFSALYGIFNSAFPIRGADFLWIKDLSQSDQLATVSFWPHELNLLPIIYAVMTIIQSRMSAAPPSDDPTQEMNRKMMMYMPLMFTFIFYHMPSGLVLYFAAQAVFGMIEYWYIKKFLIREDGVSTGGSGGSPAVVQISKKPPAPVVN